MPADPVNPKPAAASQRTRWWHKTVLEPWFRSSSDMKGLFASRPFRGLFFARGISSLGDSYSMIAVPFAVLLLTDSAADVGYAIAMRVLPTPILVLIAGVVADRFSRLRVMVAADLLRLVSQGIFAFLVLQGHAPLWQILVLQACNGIGHTFFMPASFGIMPSTVKPQLLQQANSMQFLSFSLSTVIGPAVGGVIVAVANPGIALALDAASFGVSALFLLALRGVQVSPSKEERQSPYRAFVDGFFAVITRRWIWLGITQNALCGVVYFACFSVLGPLVAVRSLNGAAGWAVVATSVGIGSVVGALLSFAVRSRYPLRIAFASLAGTAPLLALLAIPAPVAVLAAAAFLSGLAIQVFNALWTTTLQENLDPDMRSRVNSYDWLGSLALRPLGFAVIGPIALFAGTATTFVVSAVLIVLLTLAPLAFSEVRNLPAKQSEEDKEVEFPRVS